MRRALLLLLLAGLIAPASSAAAGPFVKVTPERIDFGTRPVGTTDRATVTITNVTSGPVFVGGLSVTGDRGGFVFAFGTQNCPTFLDPGASCSYGIDFNAFRRGYLVGRSSVSVASGNVGQTVTIPLLGRGVRETPIAHPKTRQVDDDRAECPHAGYTRIQAAVHAAAPGDRIVVCPGTYAEQVRIVSTPQIALEAKVPGTATIRFPQPPKWRPAAVLQIDNSDEVDVRGFTFSGPLAATGACADPSGILVDGAAGTVIEGNRFTHLGEGCGGDGVGVWIARSGTADVIGNTFDRYGAAGVWADGQSTGALIQSNTITGPGLAGSIGIEMGDLATGRVEGNRVSGNARGIVATAKAAWITFATNDARGNAELDCADASHGKGTAGTANVWKRDNRGEHNSPAAICKP
ncbi:MAG: hypothetical protein QOG63_1351 [Thermoleophilaceae bacterium]|nr:hypothetical protein [Thermoleophilaceae bacterium]